MKFGISTLALNLALAGVAAPAALAQDRTDQFKRDRFVAVAERLQPDFDQQPVNAGGFDLWSSLLASANYGDNIYAVQDHLNPGQVDPNFHGPQSDTFINLRPQAELRSKWTVHALNAGVIVDHKEYLNQDSETVTDYNGFVGGRLDVTRSFNFNGTVAGGRYTEPRYAPASQTGAAEPTRYDHLAIDVGANLNRDRIQVEGRVGQMKDNYDDVPSLTGGKIDQDFRDLTENFFFGRASYAVSPAVAVFVQGRRSNLDYKETLNAAGTALAPTRDSTRTYYQLGVNFELSAPFRGDIAVGQVQEDKDNPAARDYDGLAVNARLMWFPTELTTVTVTGLRETYDPGLPGSTSAFNTLVGVHLDHELLRNLVLFGDLSGGKREYQDVSRDDTYTDLKIGAGYKLNRNARIDASYSFHTQKDDPAGVLFDREFDQNFVSVGLKIYP